MIELREVFEAEAAGVPSYDVAGEVLRGARRRRRIRRVVPVAAAVVALAVAVPVVASAVSGARVPIVAGDGAAIEGTLPWLPKRLDPSGPEPAPLPADRAVGPGALVWVPCRDTCAPRLVTADGTQYTLPIFRSRNGATPERSRLSPDGRWLSYPNADGSYTLRDLTGVQAVSTGSRHAVGWSADGQWAALTADPSDRGAEVVLRPDAHDDQQLLPTEQYHGQPSLPADERRSLAGLTNAGDAVFGPPQAHEIGGPVVLRVTDRTGVSRTVAVATDGVLRPDEEVADQAVIASDGATVLLQVISVAGRIGTPGDLLRVDLADGAVLGRIRLPAPTTGTFVTGSPDTGPSGGEHRTLVGSVAEGALLMHWRGDRPDQIELLDPATGRRQVVCTMVGPPATWIALRGQP